MTDHRLLRILSLHGLMGAALGGLFFAALLIFNILHVRDVVQNNASPWTTTIILFVGCCTNFAFGAAITGFHFAITDDNPDRRSRQ